MTQSRMIERNSIWKRRLAVTGVATFVGLTAIIGKQAEHAAQAAAQDQSTTPVTTTNPIVTSSGTVGLPAAPATSVAEPGFSFNNPWDVQQPSRQSPIVQQPNVSQAPITRIRTRTGSSRG